MNQFKKHDRFRGVFRSVGLSLAISLVTLVALEFVLRIADFGELRETLSGRSLSFGFDSELGWAPVPYSSSTIETFRTTHYKHNGLGLRDEEFVLDAKPTIMFLGDSFVWVAISLRPADNNRAARIARHCGANLAGAGH